MRVAFLSVGKAGLQRGGMDGTRNSLEVASAVAAAACHAQRERVGEYMASLEQPQSHVIGRYYDATPMRLSFRSQELREKLLPLARYTVWDEASGGYKLVPHSVYTKMHPRAKLTFGVLEVFAQQVTTSGI